MARYKIGNMAEISDNSDNPVDAKPAAEDTSVKRGRGRPKGSGNKVTAMIRGDIVKMYYKLGGLEFLMQLPELEQVKFIQLMVPKMVESKVELTGELTFEQQMVKLRQARLVQRKKRVLENQRAAKVRKAKAAKAEEVGQ